jgi:predicted ester cyclase
MAIDMKQQSRRLIEEAYGKGNVDVFDEICSSDYRSHDPFTGDATLQQEKELCRSYRTAFSDLKPTVLATFADGETVVVHWRMTGMHTGPLRGIAPTGARCTVEGISIGRYRGGRLSESWLQWDALGLLRQLGVAPSAQAGAGAKGAEKRPST